MATKKGNKKTIGAGEFEYTQEQVDDSKQYVENFDSHYEMSMFLNYHHEFKPYWTFLSDVDSLLTFFYNHVEFENKSNDEILSFIKEYKQEIRDMFRVKANQINLDNLLAYEAAYELDEDFHLIRKIRFDNSHESQLIAATFLFSDMICKLWEKYNKEEINYKINTLDIEMDYYSEGKKDKVEDGTFPKEYFPWDRYV